MPLTTVPGAPGQGALAVECRTDDAATRQLLAALEDPATRGAIAVERQLLSEHGGGCHQRFGATLQWLPAWEGCCTWRVAVHPIATSASDAGFLKPGWPRCRVKRAPGTAAPPRRPRPRRSGCGRAGHDALEAGGIHRALARVARRCGGNAARSRGLDLGHDQLVRARRTGCLGAGLCRRTRRGDCCPARSANRCCACRRPLAGPCSRTAVPRTPGQRVHGPVRTWPEPMPWPMARCPTRQRLPPRHMCTGTASRSSSADA